MDKIPKGVDVGLSIPTSELPREAVDALRGYSYQLFQTIAKWMDLRSGEVLYLEVAEDFVVATNNALMATQVKSTSGTRSLTLRDKSVKRTLDSFWELQANNPDKVVSVNFLTTAAIGREAGGHFPDGAAGISYWDLAARSGVDVEPIRDFLLRLDLSRALSDWIRNATPEILRSSLLQRVRWLCERPDFQMIHQTILERLYELVRQQSPGASSPSIVDLVFSELLTEVVVTITQSSPSLRRLTELNFDAAFEKGSTVRVPINELRRYLGDSAGSSGGRADTSYSSLLRVAEMPLSPDTSLRESVVSEMATKLDAGRPLWLHGSNGTGKTTLALLLAKSLSGDWYFVSLRNTAPEGLERELWAIQVEVSSCGSVGGLIIDDLPAGELDRIRPPSLNARK